MPAAAPILDSLLRTTVGRPEPLGPLHRHVERLIFELLDPPLGGEAGPKGGALKSVVDVGCGDGLYLQAVSRRYRPKRVLGLDISQAALDEADKNVFGDFELLDIDSGAREGDETFQLVLVMELFEQLREPEAAAKRLAAMLAEGGHMLVVGVEGVGNGSAALTRGALQRFVEGAGLRVHRQMRWGWPFCAGPLRGVLDKAAHDGGLGRHRLLRWAAGQALFQLYRFNATDRGDVVFLLAGRDG